MTNWAFYTRLLWWLLPLLLLGTFSAYMNWYVPAFLDSDMSSELILSHTLAEENKLITDSWFYSQELRVLNTQFVFAPLFKLGASWHTVRVVGSTILLALLGIASLCLARVCHFSKWEACLCCCIMLVPFTRDYLRYVMIGSYYVPHICISLLTLASLLWLNSERRQEKRHVSKAIAIATVLLALLAGMGGLRQAMILYLPLCLATIMCAGLPQALSDWRTLTRCYCVRLSSLLLLTNLLGYAINRAILSHIYSFVTWLYLQFTHFSLERLMVLFNGFLDSFGYRTEVPAMSPSSLLHNGLAILLLCMLGWVIIRGLRLSASNSEDFAERLLSCYLLAGVLLFAGIYGFTNMSHENRYALPFLIFMFPAAILMLRRLRQTPSPAIHRTYLIALVVLFFLNAAVNGMEHIPKTMPTEPMCIAQTLHDQGYLYGYGTFWCSNLLTELSNGAIEMHVWPHYLDKIKSLDDAYPWLQLKKHATEIPKGQVFVILSHTDSDTELGHRLNRGLLLYEGNRYRVLGYPSYHLLKRDAAQ